MNCFPLLASLLPSIALFFPTFSLAHYVLSFTNSLPYSALSFDCNETPSDGTNLWVPHKFTLRAQDGYVEFTLPDYQEDQSKKGGRSDVRAKGELKRKREREEDQLTIPAFSSSLQPLSELPGNPEEASSYDLPAGFKVICEINTVPTSKAPCTVTVFDPYGNPYPLGQQTEEPWARFDWKVNFSANAKRFYLLDPQSGELHAVVGWVTRMKWPPIKRVGFGWAYRPEDKDKPDKVEENQPIKLYNDKRG